MTNKKLPIHGQNMISPGIVTAKRFTNWCDFSFPYRNNYKDMSLLYTKSEFKTVYRCISHIVTFLGKEHSDQWMKKCILYNCLFFIIRYLEIVHPIWHKTHFKKKWLYICFAIIWPFGMTFNAAYMIPTTKVNWHWLFTSFAIIGPFGMVFVQLMPSKVQR